MKRKKIRSLFLFILLVTLLIYYFYPCLSIKFIRLPEFILEISTTNTEYVYILYGTLCLHCPSGDYFKSIKKKASSIFIVPSDFSRIDIENLKTKYEINGTVLLGNEKIISIIKKFAKCKGAKNWRQNFRVQVNQTNRIDKFTRF
jgi:hypothetical protein